MPFYILKSGLCSGLIPKGEALLHLLFLILGASPKDVI